MFLPIKAFGIRLPFDDFGIGYSSLSYLHRLPLETLKMDRSFISGMCEGGEGVEIARTIMPLANHLRLDVVAEGVETIVQVAFLRKLHGKFAQDFYFSKPLAAEEAGALLIGQPAWK